MSSDKQRQDRLTDRQDRQRGREGGWEGGETDRQTEAGRDKECTHRHSHTAKI